jgi:hypothetical protein
MTVPAVHDCKPFIKVRICEICAICGLSSISVFGLNSRLRRLNAKLYRRPSLCAPAHDEKLRNRNFFYGQRPHHSRSTH